MWDLRAELEERRQAGLYRRTRALPVRNGEALLDGRRAQVFCSNDYLGLADDPRVIAAFRRAAEEAGVGAGAAHLVSGHRPEHQALEEELADFLGRERVLLFSTGYMANLGVVAALLDERDAVYQDKLNHASLLDAGRLSGARMLRYAHSDTAHLARRLAGGDYRRRLIVTDGVFSMDGDLAPLPELVALAKEHRAWLMVDDAHGLGVLGARGAGSLEHFGLSAAEVPVLMGTLGKALGSFGAFVAGSAELIELLTQKARTFVYTTATPPAVAAATRESLRLVREEPWRRERLRSLIGRLRQGAAQLDLPLMASDSPIQPLLVGEAERAVRLSQALERRGFLVTAIRPPTVPAGTARLRITLTATHRDEQVDALLDALAVEVSR